MTARPLFGKKESVCIGILMLISLFWLYILSRNGILELARTLFEIDTSSGYIFAKPLIGLLGVSMALAIGIIFYVAVCMLIHALFDEQLHEWNKKRAIQEAQRYIDEDGDTE